MVQKVITLEQRFQRFAYDPYLFAFLAGISAYSIFPKKPPILQYLFRTTTSRYVALFLLIWITTSREFFWESLIVTLGFYMLQFVKI